jgi:L-fuculokinase
VVGGGSKNDLWNQLRADLTGLPIMTIDQKEATVVGAAMFAFIGAGEFGTLHQAQAAMTGGVTTIEPSADRECYEALYGRYRQLLKDLSSFYSV